MKPEGQHDNRNLFLATVAATVVWVVCLLINAVR